MLKSYSRFIIESGINKRVIYTFARMNPVSRGHELLISKMKSKALQENADLVVFLSQSVDRKKNPLTLEQKIRYFKLSFPEVTVKALTETKDLFKTTQYLIDNKYNHLTFCCGSDREADFTKLKKYFENKTEATLSMYLAGCRDLTEEITKISASKMREYVEKNDFNSFYSCCPSSLNVRFSREMYNDIKRGMNE